MGAIKEDVGLQSTARTVSASTDGAIAPVVYPSGDAAVVPGPAKPSFEDGALIANRYRIVRFLGGGGMGEVYEATDVLLRTAVALKTLYAAKAQEPHAIERLRREITYARRITHRNVARVFDVAHHLTSASDGAAQRAILFFSMELLAGESLAARLARVGRLTVATALPIVADMVAGLEAAHTAGVVHRDFKSGNVMLVPSDTGRDRAVVMDFGLARAVGGDEAGAGDLARGGAHRNARVHGARAADRRRDYASDRRVCGSAWSSTKWSPGRFLSKPTPRWAPPRCGCRQILCRRGRSSPS